MVKLSPSDFYSKVGTTRLPTPELVKFDFNSILEEIKNLDEEIVQPYISETQKRIENLAKK